MYRYQGFQVLVTANKSRYRGQQGTVLGAPRSLGDFEIMLESGHVISEPAANVRFTGQRAHVPGGSVNTWLAARRPGRGVPRGGT